MHTRHRPPSTYIVDHNRMQLFSNDIVMRWNGALIFLSLLVFFSFSIRVVIRVVSGLPGGPVDGLKGRRDALMPVPATAIKEQGEEDKKKNKGGGKKDMEMGSVMLWPSQSARPLSPRSTQNPFHSPEQLCLVLLLVYPWWTCVPERLKRCRDPPACWVVPCDKVAKHKAGAVEAVSAVNSDAVWKGGALGGGVRLNKMQRQEGKSQSSAQVGLQAYRYFLHRLRRLLRFASSSFFFFLFFSLLLLT